MADTTVENLACIHCSVRPRIGVGTGRMGESCVQCITEVQDKGICPICVAEVGTDALTEHMQRCKGKPPRKPKAKKPKLGDDGRTLEQIHRDAAAQSGLEARREAAAALKAMTPEQRAEYKAKLKAEGEAAKAAKITVSKDDPEGVMPTGRCPTCETFLDDAGRCADEGCADKGKKPAMWED